MNASVGSSVGVPGTCCPLVLELPMVEPDDLGSRASRRAYRSVAERMEGGRVDVIELLGEKEKADWGSCGEGSGTGTPEAETTWEGRWARGWGWDKLKEAVALGGSSSDE